MVAQSRQHYFYAAASPFIFHSTVLFVWLLCFLFVMLFATLFGLRTVFGTAMLSLFRACAIWGNALTVVLIFCPNCSREVIILTVWVFFTCCWDVGCSTTEADSFSSTLSFRAEKWQVEE
jgi:hypothetical protein